MWSPRGRSAPSDDDLDGLSREELIAEAKRLRAGIPQRNAGGQELCCIIRLLGLLPTAGPDDRRAALAEVPARLRSATAKSLDAQAPGAPVDDREFGEG